MGEVLDSKFVDVARMRNMSMQRQLTQYLDTLSRDHEISRERIAMEQRLVRQELRELKPHVPENEGRGRPATVLPRGLTEKQKTRVLEMRKEKPGVISLEQFEDKLSQWRRQRSSERTELQTQRTKQKMKKRGRFAKIKIEEESPTEDDQAAAKRRDQFVRTCCVSKSADGLSRGTTFLF